MAIRVSCHGITWGRNGLEQCVKDLQTLGFRGFEAFAFVADDYGLARLPEFQDLLKGPVAIAFGYGDLSAPARLLGEFSRQARLRLDIVGGLVEGRVLDGEQVRQTADLPPRDVLLAQLLGTLQTPIGQLVGTIQAPVQQLVPDAVLFPRPLIE